MELKNVLIVVKDIEKAKQFYHELFGLDAVLESDGNVILTEGLVLQDEEIWKQTLGKDVLTGSNACELYFEEKNIEAFAEKLEKTYPAVCFVNHLAPCGPGRKMLRFYDPDGHLIEVRTPDCL